MTATAVFDTYWRFAAERQKVFMARVQGERPPWTEDPVLGAHRFTNAYRASDRVSQYLIRHVIYKGSQDADEVLFRLLLFRFFNKIETWETVVRSLGTPTWRTFRLDSYERVLASIWESKVSLYSGAYIIPAPKLGQVRKHANHLALIELMMKDLPRLVGQCRSLAALFSTFRSYPSLGTFLAFQLAIDLNYSEVVDFSEMDHVVAGPGAQNGLRKCFVDTAGLTDSDVIAVVAELAEREFARLGLRFQNLWGRPLQLIDCQNLFCEVDKYARVAHPEYLGPSARGRIKQKFKAAPRPAPQWYPPKWGIEPHL